jgi:hypothetical protein
MNILDLHELRDGISGATRRLTRQFNPFIHVSQDDPLIRALYAITRPATKRDEKMASHSHTPHRTKLIHATGGKGPDAPIAPFAKSAGDETAPPKKR